MNEALKAGDDTSVAKAKIMANPCMQGYGKTTPLDENSLGRWVIFAYLEAEAASF